MLQGKVKTLTGCEDNKCAFDASFYYKVPFPGVSNKFPYVNVLPPATMEIFHSLPFVSACALLGTPSHVHFKPC